MAQLTPTTGSPALDSANAALREPASTSEAETEAMFAELGVNLKEERKAIQGEKSKELQGKMQGLQAEQEGIASRIKGLVGNDPLAGEGRSQAAQIGMGAFVGVQDVLRNVYNGVVTVADSVENYAASKGYGTGDVLSENDKLANSYGEGYLDKTGEIARKVTNYAAPLVTVLASGGGLLLAAGVDAAYNFLAIDPKEQRLADELEGTGMEGVPLAMDVIDYLQTKPDDTELESRFKNMVEGAGISTVVGGILFGAAKAYKSIGKAKDPKTLETIAKSTSKVKQEVEALEKVKATAKPITAAENAALDASDVKVSSADGQSIPINQESQAAAIKAQQEAFDMDQANKLIAETEAFQKDWGPYVAPAKGTISDDNLVDAFTRLMGDAEAGAFLRGPITDEQAKAAATGLTRNAEAMERVAQWRPGQPIPNGEDLIAVKVILGQSDEMIGQSADRLLADMSEGNLMGFVRDLENYTKIKSLQEGISSEQGRALRSNQVLAQLAGMGEPEALKAIGAQGRAKLADGVMNKYGGREKVRDMAKNVKFIKDMAAVSKVPNKDFAARMGEVVKKSSFMKMESAITKVALNGMLSSPLTSMKALITNAATTSKSVVDNYFEVGIGKFSKGDSKTLAEANAHMKGVFMGFFEAVRPAAEAFRTGIPPNGAIARLDLAPALARTEISDALEMAGGAWAAKVGVPMDKIVGLPGRALMSIDTYWQTVNYKGFVNSEAVRRGMAQNLKGDELVKFVDDFKANVPVDVDKAADHLAGTNTMSKQLDGFAASIDETIEKGGQYLPFARVVLPFVKTNLNLIEYSAKNSPFAPMFSADFRLAMSQGGRAKDEAIAKVVSGSTALAGIVALAEMGLVTGPASTNREFERATRGMDTPHESSIKIGDTWVSVKNLEPISTLINMGSMLSKAAGYLREEEYEDMATAVKIMTADALTPESLAGGLSDLIDLIMDDNRSSKDVGASIASRFTPFGALMTDLRQTTDPTVRSTRVLPSDEKFAGLKDFYGVLKNKLSNQIPYLSKDLPAERNIWGDKVMLPDGVGPDAISPFATSDGADIELKSTLEAMGDYYQLNKDVALGLYEFNLKMPPRSIKNPFAATTLPLHPKTYSKFVLLNAGINPATGERLFDRTLKEAVKDILRDTGMIGKKPQDLDPEQYIAVTGEIAKVQDAYRKVAHKMILEFDGVGEQAQDQAERFMQFGGEDGSQ